VGPSKWRLGDAWATFGRSGWSLGVQAGLWTAFGQPLGGRGCLWGARRARDEASAENEVNRGPCCAPLVCVRRSLCLGDCMQCAVRAEDSLQCIERRGQSAVRLMHAFNAFSAFSARGVNAADCACQCLCK